MSLTSGLFVSAVVVLALATLALGFDWWDRHRWIRLAWAAGAAVVITGFLLFAHFVLHWVDYDFPNSFFAWIGIAVFAVCLLVASVVDVLLRWRARGYRRPPADRWDIFGSAMRWTSAVLAVPVTLLMVGTLINSYYAYFPTLYSINHSSNTQQTTLSQLNAERAAAAAGKGTTSATNTGTSGTSRTLQVTIPPTQSHFNPRPGYVWVPPAYVSGKVSHLPVVMMLSGSLGAPDGWLKAGKADVAAQAFADAHGGVAPIMVFPDENGSVTADTECVDGPRGNAETYLTQDVPAFMKANFGASIDNGSWGAIGLSGGGTCALMLSLRHPKLLSAFADFSGLTSPSPNEKVEPKVSADALFGGDLNAYYAHDPLHLVQQKPVPKLLSIFEVASDDKFALPAQQTITGLTKAAGLPTCEWVGPAGGHSFRFWTVAFPTALPLISGYLKATPATTAGFPGTCTGI